MTARMLNDFTEVKNIEQNRELIKQQPNMLDFGKTAAYFLPENADRQRQLD
jgi:hypothetical protein